MSPLPIPHSPGEISAAWLSDALAKSFPGVEVARVAVIDRHSGTTGRAKLALDYASGSRGPATVFVKLPPFSAMQRKLVAATDMGRREARFYAELAAETPIRVPRCYFAAHGDEPTDYICVLEDIEAAGCTFPKSVDEHAREHGGALIEALARLHAHFWQDPRFAGELSWIRPAMRGAFGATLVAQARERFASELPPVFAELCDLFVAHHERIADLWDEGGATLIHGDTHTGNQFLDGGRVGLYDWAVISRSPGIRDVAIFLGNSCPPEIRRAEQDGWMRAYHEGLVAAGVDAPSLDVLWKRLRLGVLYGWVAATTTAAVGDQWQPIAVGMKAMRGATQACAELETLEAFREVL